MRIASAITAALATAAVGGLLVATIIDQGYHRLRDMEEAVGHDSVAIARLHGFLELADRGKAIVLSTHSEHPALRESGRSFWLCDGRLQTEAPAPLAMEGGR